MCCVIVEIGGSKEDEKPMTEDDPRYIEFLRKLAEHSHEGGEVEDLEFDQSLLSLIEQSLDEEGGVIGMHSLREGMQAKQGMRVFDRFRLKRWPYQVEYFGRCWGE